MKFKRVLATGAVCAFTIGFVTAQKERFDHKVRNDFFAGFAGNAEALTRAMKTCETALAENPKHAEALVWHGSGLLFQSQTAFRAGDRQKGMEQFQRGLAETDDAVKLEPDNVGVRAPRGAAMLTMSRVVPDVQIARALLTRGLEDYQHIHELQKSYFDKLGEHPRGELLFGLAEGYSRAGNQVKAKEYFDRILAELKGSPYAKRAQLWSESGSLPREQTGCIGCHVK